LILRVWKIWKYAIGSFSDDKTEPYDNYVAGIRTIIFVSYMVTNAFIVSGVIRHWDASRPEVPEHRGDNSTKSVSVDTEYIKK